MKARKFIVIVLWIMMVLSLSACQKTEQTIEVASTQDLPELKIGVDTLAPFYYVDENGGSAGIDAELATEACRRAGYVPRFIKITWENRDQYLRSKMVDCLWTAFIQDGREADYRWTDPYMESRLRVITDVKSPDKDVNKLSGRGGIAVRAGSRAEDVLLNDPNIQRVYSCRTFDMAETAFVKQYAAALCGHELVLQRMIEKYAGLYGFLDGDLMTAHLGVAFSKGEASDTWEKINQALNEMKEDGTISVIYEKYSAATDQTAAEGQEAANEEN